MLDLTHRILTEINAVTKPPRRLSAQPTALLPPLLHLSRRPPHLSQDLLLLQLEDALLNLTTNMA